MTEEYRILPLDLRYPEELARLKQFLAEQELTYESDIQAAFGIVDASEELVACGCAAGSLLKCFAVRPELRGQNALGLLVSQLVQERFARGIYRLFIITRAKNRALFAHCGFTPVAETPELVLLENSSGGPQAFTAPLFVPGDENRTIGCLVMNCNPFTLGHRALVEYASGQCDGVHLFVVEEDRSLFSTPVRLRLVQEGTADLPNVRVHLSGPYMISASTFPTYFLKEGEDAARLQSELDLTLFAQKIAPPLHITKRFAGAEPLDPVTAAYNRAMGRLLPQYGIEFCEIPRIAQGGAAISASRVRALLREKGLCSEVLALVPETTARYLKSVF